MNNPLLQELEKLYNNMSIYGFDDFVGEVTALLAKHQSSLLDTLEEKLPEKKKGYKNKLHFNNGYNQALSRVNKIISDMREEL